MHFDYLFVDLSRRKQFKYLSVIRDDLSSFTELFPCPTAAFAAECLFDWICRYGIPSTFVSDRGSHFLNSLIEDLCLKLHFRHHFTLAYCPWSNGTIEVVNRRILHVLRSLLSELRLESADWPILLPLVRFALNHSSPPDRPAAVALFCGLPPSSPLESIWNPKKQSLIPVPLGSEQLFSLVEDLRQSLLQWHKKVEEKRESRRQAANTGRKSAKLPNFSLGDFVLVSNTSNVPRSKLKVIWKGPFRIVSVDSDYIYLLLRIYYQSNLSNAIPLVSGSTRTPL